MTRALVTGATGLLGPHLRDAVVRSGLEATFVGHSAVPPDLADHVSCDLTVRADVESLWADVRPELVLHAAALTNVDLCESDPELADAVNRGTAATLAALAARDGARIVLVSTDAVFDGNRGNYAEEDETAPVNAYARSKLAAEQELQPAQDHLIVRTNFFGRSERGHGLAEWLLRELGDGRPIVGFADVVFSPLDCDTLAGLLVELALGHTRGILHLGSSDATTKLEFAHGIARAYGFDPGLVTPGLLADVSLHAPRPHDTSLATRRAVEVLGRQLPSVDDGIAAMRAANAA